MEILSDKYNFVFCLTVIVHELWLVHLYKYLKYIYKRLYSYIYYYFYFFFLLA